MTGCGKSSFLRAGLIPVVEHSGVAYGFVKGGPADNPKVLFIRCTNAPLQQIADQVYEVANKTLESETPMGTTSIDLRSAVADVGSIDQFRERSREDGYLVNILRQIAKKSPKTLILVLDQAEEVLTLNSDDRRTRHQAQFFSFLQDFNSMNLDVKLIISLRTEYFGRFANAMRVDSHVLRSDAKEYLLEDFSEDMLVEAIERPTLRQELPPYPAPFNTYHFSFEKELPRQIARDLIAAKLSGGVLPVMQIVCRSLYSSIKDAAESNRVITRTLYENLGGVHGRIGDHISASLRIAFERCKLPTKRFADEEKKWRLVLANLVSIQQDGTVTTNVLPSAVLHSEARELGTAVPASDVLDVLASADVLLLRRVPLIDDRTGAVVDSYSLGHDVIGLSLHKWSTTYEETQKHLEQIARWRNYGIPALCFVALLVVVYTLAQKHAIVRNNAERIKVQAAVQGNSDYQLGLLLSMQAYRMFNQSNINPLSTKYEDVLVDSLVEAPDQVVDLSQAIPDKSDDVIPDFSLEARSGDRILLAYTLFPEFQFHGLEVNLGEHDPTWKRLPIPRAMPEDHPKMISAPALYFSRDGREPLYKTYSEVQVTNTNGIQTIPLAAFRQSIKGLRPDATRLGAFGREQFLVRTCILPTCPISSIKERSESPLSFEARNVGADLLKIGSESTVLTGIKVGSSYYQVRVENLPLNKLIVLYQADEHMQFTDLGPLPSYTSTKGDAIRAVSFAPNDTALALLVAAKGKYLVRVIRPNWTSSEVEREEISLGESADVRPIRVAAASKDASSMFAYSDLSGQLFFVSRGGTAIEKSPHSLFGASDLKSIEFVGQSDRLVGITEGNRLLVWNTNLIEKRTNLKRLTPMQLKNKACALAGRSLTQSEMNQYLGFSDESLCPAK